MKINALKRVMWAGVLATITACSSAPKVAMVETESTTFDSTRVPVKGLAIYYVADPLARKPGDTRRLERILNAVGNSIQAVAPSEFWRVSVPVKVILLENDYSSIGSIPGWHVLTIRPVEHIFKCEDDDCERKISFKLRLLDLERTKFHWFSEINFTEPVDVPYDHARYDKLATKIVKLLTQVVQIDLPESAEPDEAPEGSDGS